MTSKHRIALLTLGAVLAFQSLSTHAVESAAVNKSASVAPKSKPKLVLVLAFDQFRGDYLNRFQTQFMAAKAGEKVGGFNYLISQGAWFPQARYRLMQAMTGPGHSIILSGTDPYISGIAINDWYEHSKKDWVYCAEDQSQKPVGVETVDKHAGQSPRNFIGSTLGDEMKNSGYQTRVVSLALKDRSAIMMGGKRADASIWFDQKSMKWISSTWYFPKGELPTWVSKANEFNLAKSKDTYTWEAKLGTGDKSVSDAYVNPKAKFVDKIGLKFPHTYDMGYQSILTSPMGMTMTTQLAENAIEGMKLGQGKDTDILAVSYSSFDYVGHTYGPNSREMEEMALAADIEVSRLLNAVKKAVPGGLDNVAIVLTADHGVANNAEFMKSVRNDAGRLPSAVIEDAMSKALNDKFGALESGKKWFVHSSDWNFYVSPEAVASKKANPAEVEATAKEAALKVDGVFTSFTKSEYQQRILPPGLIGKQALNTYFPGRSGDVVVLPKPFFTDDYATATHFTGWNYDTTVPVVFTGPWFKPGIYGQQAYVNDIANTLAFLVGSLPPSGSEGRVLTESIKDGIQVLK